MQLDELPVEGSEGAVELGGEDGQRFVVAGRRGARWDRSSPRQDCLDGARR